MSITGVGESTKGLPDYIDDFNLFKNNLQQAADQYTNLYNVIQLKGEYSQELMQRFYYLTFTLSTLNIDPDGVTQIHQTISDFEGASSLAQATDSGITFSVNIWDAFWTGTVVFVEVRSLNWSFPNFIETVLKVFDHNARVPVARAAMVGAELAQQEGRLQAASSRSLSRRFSQPAIRDSALSQSQSAAESLELSVLDDSAPRPVASALSLRRVAATDAAVLDGVTILKRALGSTILTGAFAFLGDFFTGLIDGAIQIGVIKDKISSLEDNFKVVTDGIEELEGAHAEIVTFNNMIIEGINALTNELSAGSIPVELWDTNTTWAALDDYETSADDGRVSDGPTVLNFDGEKADFEYESEDGTKHKNDTYEFTRCLQDWSWRAPDLNTGEPTMYTRYLDFADRASETYSFIPRIKIFQTNYDLPPDTELEAVTATGGQTADLANAPFQAFKMASLVLIDPAGGVTWTDEMYATAWNTTLDYDLVIDSIETT